MYNDIRVYTRNLSDALVPVLVSRMNAFDMQCELDPNFTFNRRDCYFHYKFKLDKPKHSALYGKYLTTGFNVIIEDFNYEKVRDEQEPVQNFIELIFPKKRSKIPVINEEYDERLKKCDKLMIFQWNLAYDIFELRFATLTSAILSELTDGVCVFAPDRICFINKNLVDNTWHDVQNFENNIVEFNDLKYFEFTHW